MPSPAVGQIQLLDANGVSQVLNQYDGDWIVHLPAITSPPGDGLINELDWTVALPGFPGVIVGFWIGNDSDGDPARFASDQVLDTRSLPAWVTYFGTWIGLADYWGEPLSIVTWDGSWNVNAVSPVTSITVDSANSDPDWTGWAPPMHISSFSPSSGAVGDVIVLTGAGFTGVDYCSLGSSFTVDSDTQITVTQGSLPNGPGWYVQVGASGVYATAFDRFTVDGPRIDSFSPLHGGAGTVVVITGKGFTTATNVIIGGVYASSFTVDSDTQITATVGASPASGWLIIVNTTAFGPIYSSSSFTVDPAPTITSVSPARVPRGGTVTVSGTGFLDATDVTLDYVSIAFTIVSDSTITFVVPGDAIEGGFYVVFVTAPTGTSNSGGFNVSFPPPVITSVRPGVWTPGIYSARGITITGENFDGAAIRMGDIDIEVGFINSARTEILGFARIGTTGWYGELDLEPDFTSTVTVITPDGSATSVDETTIIPSLFPIGDYVVANTWMDVPDSRSVHFLRLDADHVLCYTRGKMVVLDVSDTSAVTAALRGDVGHETEGWPFLNLEYDAVNSRWAAGHSITGSNLLTAGQSTAEPVGSASEWRVVGGGSGPTIVRSTAAARDGAASFVITAGAGASDLAWESWPPLPLTLHAGDTYAFGAAFSHLNPDENIKAELRYYSGTTLLGATALYAYDDITAIVGAWTDEVQSSLNFVAPFDCDHVTLFLFLGSGAVPGQQVTVDQVGLFSAFAGGLPMRDPIVVASPDGTRLVALMMVDDNGSGFVNGVLGQVITRTGTTLGFGAVQHWSGSGLWPAYNQLAFEPLLPVMLTDSVLYTPAQPGPFTGALSPGGAVWSVSATGIGSTPGLTNGLPRADRIDDTHMGYQTNGAPYPVLGLATVNPSTGVVSLGATVRIDHGDGANNAMRLRQETDRPGWYRGYRYGLYSGPYDDPLYSCHAFEFHLDPSAGTATGDEVAAFGMYWDAYNIPTTDFDGSGWNSHSDMVMFGLQSAIPDPQVPMVIEWAHRFIHAPVSFPLVGPAPPDLDTIIGLGDNRFLALSKYDEFAGSAHFNVFRILAANPAHIIHGLRWGWPLG